MGSISTGADTNVAAPMVDLLKIAGKCGDLLILHRYISANHLFSLAFADSV